MGIEEFYNAIGGSYAEVAYRLQSPAVIKKFVLKFADDASFAQLKEAFAEGSVSDAFRAAHTLKGIALTLGFKKLAVASSALTEQLRPLQGFPPESYFDATNEAYGEVISAINKLKVCSV